ncbi:MAG: hypothetical protein ACYTFG_09660 [Planctomycetota bacterium]|jgi:hypothetical protein
MSTQRQKLLDRLETALLELAFVMIDVLRYHIQDPKECQLNLGFRVGATNGWELVLWNTWPRGTMRDLKGFCEEAIQRVRQRVKGS